MIEYKQGKSYLTFSGEVLKLTLKIKLKDDYLLTFEDQEGRIHQSRESITRMKMMI